VSGRLNRLIAASVCGIVAASAPAWRPGIATVVVLAQEARSVKMQTLNVRDILYVLTGSNNTLALMRDDGVLLVDPKPAGWGTLIRETIQGVTDQPVTTIINTHASLAHVGGNVEFPSATQIVAHANTKARMEKLDAFRGPNAKFLPNRMVIDRMTLLDGPDRIELYYFGKAHTDGDLVVVFPEKRLAHFGDLFPAKALPVIDVANGGSALTFSETLARAVAELKNITRITTGRIDTPALADPKSPSAIFANPRTMTWADLQEYAAFNRDFLAAVRQAVATGKTAEQAAATLQLPDRYAGYDMSHVKESVQALYRELGK
jgi:cyclase